MYVVSLSPRRLYLLAESPQYLLDMRPVCPEAELDDMEKRNFLTLLELEPKTFAGHALSCAILAPQTLRI